MPLNVRRFYTFALLVLVGFISVSSAQTIPPAPQPNPQTVSPQTVAPVKAPTAGEIMRERISKAKAFIAVRNYNAAIYELENIRRETADTSVQAVVNVLLMNSYLEQADYKKAQDFLNQAFNQQRTTKANATATYLAMASQIVKSARDRVERYRALGLNVADRTLPLEAVTDLEKMRETLEIVITQTKELGKDKAKTQDAMALLEEAANSRGLMARDDYDARHWKDEVADTREQITSSRSMVINAVNDGMPDTPANQNNSLATSTPSSSVAQDPPPNPNASAIKLMPVDPKTPTPSDTAGLVQKTVMQSPTFTPGPQKNDEKIAAAAKSADKQDTPKTLVIGNPKPNTSTENQQKPNTAENTQKRNPTVARTDPSAKTDASETTNAVGPMDVGSLIVYATKQQPPVYPVAAKNLRASGIVRVEVTVDENGDVADVQRASGPALLQGAARDAIKKWRFKPFVRDGQPVKATGFVNFNFSL